MHGLYQQITSMIKMHGLYQQITCKHVCAFASKLFFKFINYISLNSHKNFPAKVVLVLIKKKYKTRKSDNRTYIYE